MAHLGNLVAALPQGAASPYEAAADTTPRQRGALREAAMLWAMRGGMLGYGLTASLTAESIILALRALF
jgi:hypothetical protein